MPLAQAWQIDQWGNAGEAVLWTSVSAAFLCRAILRIDAYRQLAFTTSLVFFLFGLTDVAEIVTRAWYRPWWLLVANVLCVIAIAICWRRYGTIRRSDSAL